MPENTHTSARQVLLVSNSTWNIYNFRLPVVEALLRAGYRVTVLAPLDESVSALARVPGVRIVPLLRLHRDGTGFWENTGLFFEFLRHYRRIRPDLILHYTIKPNTFGNWAAALLRIPSICVVTGLGYTFLHRGWIQQLVAAMYRFSFKFARQVIFENEYDRQLLLDQGIVRAGRSISVKGCGVDTAYFSTNAIPPTPVTFTFIGRLLFDKGIREFVEAARLLKQTHPEVRCWILGGLDEHNPARVNQAQLMDWVESGAVEYKGITADVRPVLEASTWVVLPSYREGMSRVLLEAISMSRPVITTDTPGCREAVESDRNGYLVPVKNVGQLAQVMRLCSALPPDQVAAMGRYGREKAVQEFESALVGKVFLKVVENELA